LDVRLPGSYIRVMVNRVHGGCMLYAVGVSGSRTSKKPRRTYEDRT